MFTRCTIKLQDELTPRSATVFAQRRENTKQIAEWFEVCGTFRSNYVNFVSFWQTKLIEISVL